MPNLFVNLPLPVVIGPGAAVNTAAMGKDKTIVFVGQFTNATVTVEASVDGGVVFQPVAVFQSGNHKKVVQVAAEFMRVNVGGNAIGPGAANIDVGANDNGALFTALPLPPGNGAGAAVDVSAFGEFRTFIVGGTFPGAVIEIQASEDNVDWAPCLSFAGKGDIENKAQTSRFYRTFVRNRKPSFAATVAVGAANDAISAASSGNAHAMGLPEQWAVQNVPANTPATAMSAQVSTNFDNIPAIRAGFIVGMSARLTEAVTAGLLTVTPTINGVAVVGLSVVNPAVGAGTQATAAVGAIPYAAGSLLGFQFVTDAGFLPITTDLEAWLEVVEEIP